LDAGEKVLWLFVLSLQKKTGNKFFTHYQSLKKDCGDYSPYVTKQNSPYGKYTSFNNIESFSLVKEERNVIWIQCIGIYY